jgi:hypothetical protein
MAVEKLADGREAYVYEVYAPYAQNGGHILAAFTVKVRGPGACFTYATGSLCQWAFPWGAGRGLDDTGIGPYSPPFPAKPTCCPVLLTWDGSLAVCWVAAAAA